MPESEKYVTNGKLNTVIYEIKNEMKDMDNKHDRLYTELKHSTQNLNTTMLNLNLNIEKNTAVMTTIMNDLKHTEDEIDIIQKENIARDYLISDLTDFKEEASGQLAGRFGEIVKLIGIFGTIFSGIVIAIINIAPALFGGG